MAGDDPVEVSPLTSPAGRLTPVASVMPIVSDAADPGRPRLEHDMFRVTKQAPNGRVSDISRNA